jgi:hypothetical protein
MRAVRNAGVPFLLGGGFALAAYTGRWRDTKDIDFYIYPRDREQAVKALKSAGFSDYFKELPYDRKWIFRSVRSDVIVDIIWSMANQRAQVDDQWFRHARQLVLRDQELLVVPMEESMWCKLYILQRDHCDWTDIFNLLHESGARVDWRRLIERLEDDTPLLRALLTLYAWLCPVKVRQLPQELWGLLGMPAPKPERAPARNRIRLLDSRRWFAALCPSGKKLEV